MRFLSVLRKTLVETIRDWKVLLLLLLLTPAFIFVLYGFYGKDVTAYSVIVWDGDRGVEQAAGTGGANDSAGRRLIRAIEDMKYSDGSAIFKVEISADLVSAKIKIRDRAAQVLLIIPEDFSQAIQQAEGERSATLGSKGESADKRVNFAAGQTALTFYGDVTNAKYIMAATFLNAVLASFLDEVQGVKRPVEIREQMAGNMASRTEFEFYVPGLLVFAIIMILFTAAIAAVKEADRGTIRRLQMSKLRTAEFLGAVSLVQVLLSAVALLLTLLCAIAVGYRLAGSVMNVLVVGAFSSFSITAIGLMTAAFCRNAGDVMTIGNFPFFVILFCSGVMFPLPAVRLFAIGGRVIQLTDILPPAHTVGALNKVLNYGAGLGELTFELGAIALLTTAYFAAGVWLFHRRHMRLR